jgi:hypothetical protein
MGRCVHYDDEGAQCPETAVGGGLCAAHLQASRSPSATVTPEATKFTSAQLKKEFGALCKIKVDDKGGGYYLGAGAKGMHVHKYGGPGAHIKVGQKEHRFIRPTGDFDKAEWVDGVAAVKDRGADKKATLLAAMALTVCEHGGLDDSELSALLKDCRV